MGQSDESGEHKARIGRLRAGQILLGSGSDSSAISYAVEQRGAQQISAMRHRVGSGRSKLVEIPSARNPVLLLHPALIRNGLLLHEFNIQGAATAVIQIKSLNRFFVMKNTA